MTKQRRVLVTGADGFIGKNLVVRMNESPATKLLPFVRGDSLELLASQVSEADAIVHLAGENRPLDVADFVNVNTNLTKTLCDEIKKTGRNIPLILASSIQAELDNPYGSSKLGAEKVIEDFVATTANSTYIYRLTGVFGKWCKPNYNSVVATFCYNISRDLPIKINDSSLNLNLTYIDDVVEDFLSVLDAHEPGISRRQISKVYQINLGELAEQITAFRNCRTNLVSERVGTGLVRALYSTYVSYLPTNQFAYDLPKYGDERGIFVEMLKTADSGQFSFFTINPGITRGSHYHNTKTEKFLVVKGVAHMRFRHLVTGEIYEITVSDDRPQVVDTIPGWVHDITNVGEEEAIIMLWANEIFDRQHPDCIPCEVQEI